MPRSVVLAALVLCACTPGSYTPTPDPQLTSRISVDPWVKVSCKRAACAHAVLTTDAVPDGTITWFRPDGTTATGTSVTVATPDSDSPIVVEVEVAYDNGDTGHSAVAIAGTRKRYLAEEEPGSAAELIVAEVKGDDCGMVVISSIGGCFDGSSPFSFSLWEGLADANAAEPYAAMTPLEPATFTPLSIDAVSAGGADAAQVFDSYGGEHVAPPYATIPPIAHAPPFMTIQIDQTNLPAITVLPTGSQGSSSWTFTEALTFQCSGGDPFDGLATIDGN